MDPSSRYDLACIGNYTRDTIVTPAGTQVVDGGAVNYAAHAAARLGLRVAVITRLAPEDRRVVERLAAAGVDCFARYTPQSTCLRLEYPGENPDERHLSLESTAGALTVDQVAPLRARAAVIGATLRGEVGLDVVRALRGQELLLAADVQGFVRVRRGRELAFAAWDEMQATLALLDVLKADAVEAAFLTGEEDLRAAARAFARLGPKEVVLTHKDGVLVYAGGQYSEAGFYPRRVAGRSGRGDTCIGTYVAARLIHPPDEACRWAAAVTSLKLETPGPFDRPRAEVEALLAARYAAG